MIEARLSEAIRGIGTLQAERGQMLNVVSSVDALKREMRSHLEASEQVRLRHSHACGWNGWCSLEWVELLGSGWSSCKHGDH